jgi:hypothetical protein
MMRGEVGKYTVTNFKKSKVLHQYSKPIVATTFSVCMSHRVFEQIMARRQFALRLAVKHAKGGSPVELAILAAAARGNPVPLDGGGFSGPAGSKSLGAHATSKLLLGHKKWNRANQTPTPTPTPIPAATPTELTTPPPTSVSLEAPPVQKPAVPQLRLPRRIRGIQSSTRGNFKIIPKPYTRFDPMQSLRRFQLSTSNSDTSVLHMQSDASPPTSLQLSTPPCETPNSTSVPLTANAKGRKVVRRSFRFEMLEVDISQVVDALPVSHALKVKIRNGQTVDDKYSAARTGMPLEANNILKNALAEAAKSGGSLRSLEEAVCLWQFWITLESGDARKQEYIYRQFHKHITSSPPGTASEQQQHLETVIAQFSRLHYVDGLLLLLGAMSIRSALTTRLMHLILPILAHVLSADALQFSMYALLGDVDRSQSRKSSNLLRPEVDRMLHPDGLYTQCPTEMIDVMEELPFEKMVGIAAEPKAQLYLPADIAFDPIVEPDGKLEVDVTQKKEQQEEEYITPEVFEDTVTHLVQVSNLRNSPIMLMGHCQQGQTSMPVLPEGKNVLENSIVVEPLQPVCVPPPC